MSRFPQGLGRRHATTYLPTIAPAARLRLHGRRPSPLPASRNLRTCQPASIRAKHPAIWRSSPRTRPRPHSCQAPSPTRATPPAGRRVTIRLAGYGCVRLPTPRPKRNCASSSALTPDSHDAAPRSRRATRVVLADDDAVLHEGLASLLDRSGFEVVGPAGGGTTLVLILPAADGKVIRVRKETVATLNA